MNSLKLRIITISIGFLFLISTLIFTWNLWNDFNIKYPIDADRYSSFGSFLGGLFGTLSVILLIITLKETKDQSSDNLFFTTLQLHDSLVTQLKSNEKDLFTLNENFKKIFEPPFIQDTQLELREDCKKCAKHTNDDFFEALYAILNAKYKFRNVDPSIIFESNKWRMGHFLNSYIVAVELINELDVDNNKKLFYARVLRSRTSSNELRLIFYYLIFNKDNDEKKTIG